MTQSRMSNPASDPANARLAWREQVRQEPPKRPVSERVHDFFEIHGIFDEKTAREQASRCIQCPNPSCVSGCPLCNPIPQWMLLTAEGRFLEAAAVMGSATSMAEVCSRVCAADHHCEHTCILDSISEPVAIAGIERFLADYSLRHGLVGTATAPPNGYKVAVVGAGAGGLTCAELLARRGCAVTIFDESLIPGGLLVNGLPAFNIANSVVERRVDLIRKLGVRFQLGVELGRGLKLEDLRAGHDAIFLGMDSRTSRMLDVPGASLNGVVQALPFLLQKRTSVALDIPAPDVAGKRVMVLGAGESAVDCLRVAIRWGAREAVGVYRRGEPDMPCGKANYQSAIEEGARFVFNAMPKAILDDGAGGVRGMRAARTAPEGQDVRGRSGFVEVPGQEFDLEADLIVLALGFDPKPCLHSGDFSDLRVNAWGGLIVDENHMTSIHGVFAGGDVVRGPSVVLETVRDGRNAAEGILRYLVARDVNTRAGTTPA